MEDRIELTDACALEPDALTDRQAVWQRIDASVTSRHAIPGGFEVRYRAAPDVVDLLPRLAEAESGCCGFARWEVRPERDELVLAVTGSGPDLDALRRAFAVDP